jgi:hypothetical protein
MVIHFRCSNCGNSVAVDQDADQVQCGKCGQRYRLAGHLCPQCSTYYEEDTPVCRHCGESTTRLCPNCNAVNWPGADDCNRCGVSLDILEYIYQHTPDGTRDRLRGQMQSAAYFKEIEEQGSRARMSELMAIEEERQRELNRQRMVQRGQERTMLIVFLVGTAIVLVFLILFTLLS